MREDHIHTGNTVGSRQEPTIQDLAYIAGFLDGDGSIMVQVKKRSDTTRGWRIIITICLYQDTRHSQPLLWMREVFGIGYISNRNDHITEFRINGYKETRRVLELLRPYIRFKKEQTVIAIRMLSLLCTKKISEMSRQERLGLVDDICELRNHNYESHQRRYTNEALKELLGW